MPPKFGTLDKLNKQDGSGDEGDEKEQKFFVGGVGRGGGGSGQNVIDPAKMMDKVKALGGVSAAEHAAAAGGGAFVGSGYSLSGEGGAPVVQNEDGNKVRHVITIYKNGFVVDDGPLRAMADPANHAFLHAINEGRVPDEFAGEVSPLVSIIAKAGEDYVAPAAPVAFAGAGHSLGGAGAAAAAGPVQEATTTFTVDEGQPVTQLQVRLHDGSRITQRFNNTHTVGDIYAWVQTATPNASFDLLNSFPRKKLEDMAQTIEAAGLQNAALTQALK